MPAPTSGMYLSADTGREQGTNGAVYSTLQAGARSSSRMTTGTSPSTAGCVDGDVALTLGEIVLAGYRDRILVF